MTESIDQEKPPSSICDFSIKSGMSGSTNDNNMTGTTGGGVGGPTVPQTNTTGVTSSIQANAIPKAIIKNVDMSDEMQQIAVDIACEAMLKFSVEKDIAAHVKKTMDTRFGPTWHTVVGKNYGSYVTHETKHFIYFYLGQIAFLLWRA